MRRNNFIEMTHMHHFYSKRVLSILTSFANRSKDGFLRKPWVATTVTEDSSKLNRESPFGLPSQLSGTSYVSPMIRKTNVITNIKVPDKAIDYILEYCRQNASLKPIEYLSQGAG